MSGERQAYKNKWAKEARDVLVGRKIVAVEYMTDEQAEAYGWYFAGVIITLDDGTTLTPSCDDEGNNAGAIFTSNAKLPIIPVI